MNNNEIEMKAFKKKNYKKHDKTESDLECILRIHQMLLVPEMLLEHTHTHTTPLQT